MAVLRCWATALALLVALTGTGSPAPPASEYGVKAVCLFYFAKFTDWPTNAFADVHSPVRIGVLGEDPFGADLDKLVKGKTVRGRPVEIIRSRQLEVLKSCHILFISRSEIGPLPRLEGAPTLVVGDADDFLDSGGMIQFVIVDKKVRFEINKPAIDRAGLDISSEVLRLAQHVRTEGGGK